MEKQDINCTSGKQCNGGVLCERSDYKDVCIEKGACTTCLAYRLDAEFPCKDRAILVNLNTPIQAGNIEVQYISFPVGMEITCNRNNSPVTEVECRRCLDRVY